PTAASAARAPGSWTASSAWRRFSTPIPVAPDASRGRSGSRAHADGRIPGNDYGTVTRVSSTGARDLPRVPRESRHGQDRLEIALQGKSAGILPGGREDRPGH